MKNVIILIIAATCAVLIPNTLFSQQTSTLKLKFGLTDADGDYINPNDSNYFYVDYWNEVEVPLSADNDQIKYDTVSSMFVVIITVPRYNEYSFALKNKSSKESMIFKVFMDGNLSEQLTIDEIQFTPGVFVFNLTNGVHYFNKENLNYSKGSKEEFNIKGIDWKATQINK